jgi:anaerobic selenocysteine-containing dehydrogenase
MRSDGSQGREGVAETKRRDFLKLAGAGAAASAAVTGGAPAAVAAEAPAAPTAGRRGYRETAHVKKVYELARF